jgi:hypothetical protein
MYLYYFSKRKSLSRVPEGSRLVDQVNPVSGLLASSYSRGTKTV